MLRQLAVQVKSPCRGSRSTPLNKNFNWHCSSVLLEGPPKTYSLHESSYIQSLNFISENYPDLKDLVEEGSLIVHERSPDYDEWRTDEYIEPEQIFILGTCHVSSHSASSAKRVIETIQPESVVLELCRSRVAVLFEKETDESLNAFLLSGDSFRDALIRSIKLGGGYALVLRALLASITERLTSKFELDSGEEMRTAYQSADAINAQVILGDRPVEITLQRTWKALSWYRKIEFICFLFQGLFMSESELNQMSEEMKNEMDNINNDMVAEWTRELTETYPELASPLIYERDVYLAWSLKRSKAVNGTKRVVGVVGRGHLQGIYYTLQNDKGELRFKDLVGTPASTSKNPNKVVRKFALESIIFGLCFILIQHYWNGSLLSHLF